MRFERERDIAAFKGKKGREILALRRQAEERDPWIWRLKCLNILLILMPMLRVSFWLSNYFFPRNFWLPYIVFFFSMYPVEILFYGLVITPRIRKALESNTQLAA